MKHLRLQLIYETLLLHLHVYKFNVQLLRATYDNMQRLLMPPSNPIAGALFYLPKKNCSVVAVLHCFCGCVVFPRFHVCAGFLSVGSAGGAASSSPVVVAARSPSTGWLSRLILTPVPTYLPGNASNNILLYRPHLDAVRGGVIYIRTCIYIHCI